jgi:hypothetical protein
MRAVKGKRFSCRWVLSSALIFKGLRLRLRRPDQRFRKPFPPPYPSSLRLTQAHSSQGLRETRILAGIGWNELE